MSDTSLAAKIEFMLEMCDNIDKIVHRHGGIVKALKDYEGVDIAFIETIIRVHLPLLRKKLEKIVY